MKVLNKSWTWESIVTRLREVYGARFIRKPEPEVDKVAVKKADLPAADLAACGLKMHQDENFYAEPDRTPTEVV